MSAAINANSMDEIRTRFIDRILFATPCCTILSGRMALLSGPFGSTAGSFRSKCHETTINLENGQIEKPFFGTMSKLFPSTTL
ncbi:hypothetical protein L596_020335 [Steinernema carpocapsae]|uniref:Uncharacterized protein n=1 Tax=Steinernema carpocapsae TaxID=34508 RepID=A0A4U5MT82_STECR|nr:hypothetical protein L596_020335 [Steinernema carpocapsae]